MTMMIFETSLQKKMAMINIAKQVWYMKYIILHYKSYYDITNI